MSLAPRAFRASIAACLLAGAALPALSQVAAPATAPAASKVDRSPWLYKNSDIPQDPAWSFGTLPNGLRFAVRRNGAPPGQVSVRVRIDAGSLHERDDERGFAHFIEHLSFRGSEHVPDGEAKRVWQRFGATFGSDSNASTTPTQTVYKLDLPSATEAGLNESLRILSGMMDKPTITPEAIGLERPVVLAEQREGEGPQLRFGDTMRQVFFAGQPLADRSPIGQVRTLEAATAPGVRAFHDRWYRPERALVVIAGDIDPALSARLIEANFSAWRGVGAKPADPDFGKPDARKPASGTIAEPGIPPVVVMGVMRPWRYQDDTVVFNQRRMVDILAARLISRRLEQRARAGGSFLQAGVSVEDVSRSANMTSVNIVPIGDDWETAVKEVRAVIADAEAQPPSQAEIDRELADFDTIMRTAVETERVEASGKQADEMGEAVDIRETVTNAAGSYSTLTQARAKNMFTPAALLQSTRKIFQGVATRAVINTRVPDQGVAAKLAAALKADVTGLAGKRAEQAAVDFSKLPALGAPGTVTERQPIGALGMEKVTFANGVRLLLFANEGETGRVYVRARFGGGYNALPADQPSPAWAGDLALVESGVGPLGQGDLDQLTAGRRIGLDFAIGDDAFQLAALTSPADYADQLRLMAAKLAFPRWDAAPVARARASALAGYAGFETSPDGVLARDLEGLLRDGDPRWGTPTREEMEATTAPAFRQLWEPLLEQGPIEVSVFGAVKADEAIAAVAKTFGALKPRAAVPAPAPAVRFPAHVAMPVVRTHSGPDNQAAAVIAWPTGGGADALADSWRLDVLAAVFSDRLFERLRSAEGASYSPQVVSQWPVGLSAGGRLLAIGKVSPDKVELFFRMAREIAADLVANPIAADELKRTMFPMAQQLNRASTANLFWMGQMGGGAFDQRRLDAALARARDFGTITPAQLQAIAAKYLLPERDWSMAVLPKSAARQGAAAVGTR